jgi:hypothetical protein
VAALLASAQVTVDLSCQQQLLTFSSLLFQGANNPLDLSVAAVTN